AHRSGRRGWCGTRRRGERRGGAARAVGVSGAGGAARAVGGAAAIGLEVHALHAGCGVALSRRDAPWRDFRDAAEVVRGQPDALGAGVLLEVLAVLRAGDGDHVATLREEPRQRQLRGRAAFLRCDAAHLFDEPQVAREVLALETRMVAAPVVRGQILRLVEPAGEKAAPERTVR